MKYAFVDQQRSCHRVITLCREKEVSKAGFALSLAAVKRLRKRLGLRCKQNRKDQATADSQHNLPVAPNLLDRQFAQGTAPNQAWVADITSIATDEGWLYLAAVKDLFTCKIVGWAMDERMKADLMGKALFMAPWDRASNPRRPTHRNPANHQYVQQRLLPNLLARIL